MPPVYKVVFLLFLASSPVLGQSFFEKIRYQAESGIYLSTSGKTPFLMRANQYGIVPLESPIVTLRGSAFKEYDSTYNSNNRLNRFAVGYGLNAVANVGKISQIVLPEAYIKMRYGAFEFYAGRRKEIVGLVDTTLTSGSYIWSGNALPLPKIQIAIPNYIPILGRGLISVKGAYSHGWFDNGAVKNFYLHQKYLYARMGKPNWKIKLHTGFNHQVQWGGELAIPYTDLITGTVVTKLLSGFDTYLKVVSGVSLNKGDTGLPTSVPTNEAWNRAGNHLGTIDIAIEINLKQIDVFLYRQSIYEDGSLFYLSNIEDGLAGVSIKRKNVKTGIIGICFEYFNSINQGGIIDSKAFVPQLRGQDNYFNNGIYSDGWTYKGRVIGIPFLMPINTIDKRLLIDKNLNSIPPSYILNRLEAFSLALEGTGKNIDFSTKVTFSKHLGTYVLPIHARQFSFLYNVRYRLPRFTLVSNIAFDEGKLFPSSFGAYVGIQRVFF